MAVKKSDLYSSLWASCDELRGGMDATQYKDYVLFMLFIKYVSDKYANSDDLEPPITIPKGSSFGDMIALKGNPNIGDLINTQIIQPLVDSNESLARTDFPDFNDPNKLGEGNDRIERLTNLIAIFESPDLDFSKNRADHDDILGDAYEYLMRHFATESGKSKGQFYTPSEVSRIIAKVIGISPKNTVAGTTAYDPTCGSGSLLLKVAAEAGRRITLEGQEKDVTTAGLARMNMILHDFPTARIVAGNTLASPKFLDGDRLRTYDYVVANPPFSDKAWSNGIDTGRDPHARFSWGAPPRKKGDYAYLLHIIRSMRPNGKAACILPHGALGRGNAETEIRKALLKSGFLKGIIGLPPNLFYGTSIPACIIVLDKENAAARRGIFIVDASKGFRRDGAKNRLREQDIHRIVDTFTRATDVPGFARMVPHDEIAADGNSYSLSLRRYIDSSEAEDIQDIDAHLNGGIPVRDIDALATWWTMMPSLRGQLFADNRPGYLSLTLPVTKVKAAIEGHAEFHAFKKAAGDVFAGWRTRTSATARTFGLNAHPKELIEVISEDLLEAFRKAPLVDAYNVYQHLMDFWAETMQDDAYLIAAAGWAAGAAPREILKRKNKEGKLVWPEPGDYQIGKRRFTSDLVPSRLIIARYFAADQAAIDALDARMGELEQEMTEKLEDGAGEDGLLTEVIEGEGEKQKITAKAIRGRLKDIWRDADLADEREALFAYQFLIDDFDEMKKRRKAAAEKLYAKVHTRYAALTDDEVKELVAGDKWLASIEARVVLEVSQAAQLLTARTRLLAERYNEPLPKLKDDVARLDGRVTTHRQLLRRQKRLTGFSDQWREVSFFEAVSIVSGQVDPKSEPYRSMVLIGSEHIESGTGIILSLRSAAAQGAISGKYLFRRGDILYGKINPHLRKVAIAPFDGICSADIYPLRPRSGYSSRFLLSVLLAKEFTEFAVSLSARSGIPKINREELAGFRFCVPDEFEQEAIAVVLNDVDEELATMEKHLRKLRSLSHAVTQSLLSGQHPQVSSNTLELVERDTANA